MVKMGSPSLCFLPSFFPGKNMESLRCEEYVDTWDIARNKNVLSSAFPTYFSFVGGGAEKAFSI